MASKAAIAISRETALTRILAVLAANDSALDLDRIPGRDPALREARTLEAIADALEARGVGVIDLDALREEWVAAHTDEVKDLQRALDVALTDGQWLADALDHARSKLDLLLREKTKADLETLADEQSVDLSDLSRKDDYVGRLVDTFASPPPVGELDDAEAIDTDDPGSPGEATESAEGAD